MSSEERSSWLLGILAIVSVTVYVVLLLARADGRPLEEVPYADLMLWTIGGSIVVTIIVTIVVGILAGMIFPSQRTHTKDVRDREIYRRGEYAGQAFLVIGGLAALLMALAELDTFWIANTIYLGFVLSAILGSIVKVVAYRRGLGDEW